MNKILNYTMDFRKDLTTTQRAVPLQHTINPGFVHYRKIQTILAASHMQVINNMIKDLPDLPEWQKYVQIDHIYTKVLLTICQNTGIRSLQDILATKTGRLFCSTEKLAPCKEIYESNRVVSVWVPTGNNTNKVEFHYSTIHIHSDTLKSRLYSGEVPISIIGELSHYDNNIAVFEPIIMGAPWLVTNGFETDFDYIWYGYEFFENFVEDFDEFSNVKKYPLPRDSTQMKNISERAFKICLAELLGDSTFRDWGGETSDYFTAHLHLHSSRKSAAFLLKGPSRFEPMGLNHLGKNNDQIVRLSHEPAQILIVQHCHYIVPAVRETLRAFAVQPSNPRRYCLIDGRDSLRLLYAYNLYEKALLLSEKAEV